MTPYDLVSYPNHTHPQTHPDRLAVLGTLFGLAPAPVTRCRVLELGCGNGSNLIPMAHGLPESEFVGIDLAGNPVAAGNEFIRELGLKNIRLTKGDVMAMDQSWGKFDYIIAHGLYAWVPPEVRTRILGLCRELLQPQGIAFISYNAYPGAHVRDMFRDMLLFHLRGVEEPQARVEQARALLSLLATTSWMNSEAESILKQDPAHLFHDNLAPICDAFYFTQFVTEAARHNLLYLAEADFFEMSDHLFTPEARKALKDLSSHRILREQYMDFLKGRRFRQTLLCHREAQINAEPQQDRVPELFVSCRTVLQADTDADSSKTVYTGSKGATVETDYEAGKQALAFLEGIAPECIKVRDLVSQIRTQIEKTSDPQSDVKESELAHFLLRIYAAGLIEFRTFAPAVAANPGETPIASVLARAQIRRGTMVNSLLHGTIQIEDDLGVELLRRLDGTRTIPTLVDELVEFLTNKKAFTETDPEKQRILVRTDLEKSLQRLARVGLLTRP